MIKPLKFLEAISPTVKGGSCLILHDSKALKLFTTPCHIGAVRLHQNIFNPILMQHDYHNACTQAEWVCSGVRNFAKIFLYCFFLLNAVSISNNAFCQSQNEDGWNFISSKQGVEAYYRISRCSPDEPDLLHFKFSNTNSFPVEVRWEEELAFGDLLVSSKSVPEIKISEQVVNLNAGESKEGWCRQSNLTVLLFRIPAYLENKSVTDVKLVDLIIQ